MTYPFPNGFPFPYSGSGLNNPYLADFNTNVPITPLMGNFPSDPLSAQLFTQQQFQHYLNPNTTNHVTTESISKPSTPYLKHSEPPRKRKEPEVKEPEM
jgi:hypothetical protein